MKFPVYAIMGIMIAVGFLLTSLLLIPIPPRVAFVGDSITLGALSTGYVGYVGYLMQEQQFTPKRFVAYHFDTAMLGWQQQVAYWHPDKIVIELGIHAVAGCDHWAGGSPENFETVYNEIVDLALETAPEVILVEIPWLNWSPGQAEKARTYNVIIRDIAVQHGLEVVGAWRALEDCGMECIASDGFHPNDQGHLLVAGTFPNLAPIWRMFLPISQHEQLLLGDM